MNGDGYNYDALYIPTDEQVASKQFRFASDSDRDRFMEYVHNDKYLSKHRGEYAERNGARTPFEHIFDLHIAQDFYIMAGGKRNTLQLTFDVFNLGNLISKDWGRRYYVNGYYGNYGLIKFVGFEADGTTPKYNFTAPKGDVWGIDDSGILSSRWQAQIGIRYIFN